MKKLRDYQEFNVDAFLADKKVVIGAMKPSTNEKDIKAGYGFILKLMILDDPKNEGINNGESLNIKLKKAPQLKPSQTFTFGNIRLKNAVGVVYGDYNNNLSIKADSLVDSRE